MVKHGVAPYLECSSQGDKRFSAFYARICARNNSSIEEVYQTAKVFMSVLGTLYHESNWRKAKGQRPENLEEVKELYSKLWDEYIFENPDLVDVLVNSSGLSDVFGQLGHCCQATELWRIREIKLKNKMDR